jgi:uncharacterized protein with HEPN domain
MKKDNLVYPDHILNRLRKATDYIDGVSYADFLKDEEKQDAIIRKIEVAGEATKSISAELRERYDRIPWRAIAGMRDKLVHHYSDVDLDVVWGTVTREIPELIPEIEAIVHELETK